MDRVGDEIGLDDAVAVKLAAAGEISFLAFESVGEGIRIVDHEVFAVKQVENQRRGGDGQQPRLFISLPVEMLVVRVERNRE